MATSNNSITDRILVRADALNPDFPKDAQTLREILLKPHDDVEIAVALMRGATPVDSSQIARIRIEIFDIGARNAPEPREATLLFEKSSTDIRAVSQSCDNNATFALSADENAFSAGAKWLRICAFSPAGKRTTFAQGWINVENSYDIAKIIVPAFLMNPYDLFQTSIETVLMRGRRYGGSSIRKAASLPRATVIRRIFAMTIAKAIPTTYTQNIATAQYFCGKNAGIRSI